MKKELVKFEVKGLPPTSNHALKQGRGGRRYPSKEYKEWKEKVSKLKPQEIVDSEWYEVEVTYYFPLYYKNGNIRRKDHRNLNKYADDEFCKLLGIDDKQIKTGSDDKQDCKEGEERTVWTLWAVG
jgi:Holliday junction resolvase RusA-like endonuclease